MINFKCSFYGILVCFMMLMTVQNLYGFSYNEEYLECPDQPFQATASGTVTERYKKTAFIADMSYAFCYYCQNYPATYQGYPQCDGYHPGGDGPCGCTYGGAYTDHTSQWYGVYCKPPVMNDDTNVPFSKTFTDSVNYEVHYNFLTAKHLGPLEPKTTHNCNTRTGPPSSWCFEESLGFVSANLIATDTNPAVIAAFSNGSISTTNPYDHLFAYATNNNCVDYYTLTVNKSGAGSGQVSSNPPGIDCGLDCSEDYAKDIVITLTANPDADSRLEGWSGCNNVDGPTCQVKMASDANVTAVFIPAPQDPLPDIKANGSDTVQTITRNDPLSVTVSLIAGDRANENADWFVLADTSSYGWYYFNRSSGWQPGIHVTYRGPLFDLSTFEVMNSKLDVGVYTFYFGVDMNMNGQLDMGDIFYDRVVVSVIP